MSKPDTVLTERSRSAQDKARVLREALPWITRWAGRTVVVKCGGSALASAAVTTGAATGTGAVAASDGERADRERADGEPGAGERGDGESANGGRADGQDGGLLRALAGDIALLQRVGLRVVVVHGGGPQITDLAGRLGLAPDFVDGQRVTDAAMLEVVEKVLLGEVNPALVNTITAAGTRAAGLAGTDAELLVARASDPRLGYVGEVDTVNPESVRTLLDGGVVPVVATVGRDPHGRAYNINADTAASALASALGADKLIYLTDVPGLYADFGAESAGTTADGATDGDGIDDAKPTLVSSTTATSLRRMLEAGELHTGMVPKIGGVVSALEAGVGQTHLLDGRVEHALLLEIFTDEGVGTMILPGESPR
jgi:acetylglutamate kinase